MPLPDLTNQNIQDTYQRVLQRDATGSVVDGTGSLFLPPSASHAITASYAVSASHEITYELSSSYADTASVAIKGHTVRNTTDADFHPVFVDTNNSALRPETLYTSNATLKYNPNKNYMTLGSITASSTISASGDVYGGDIYYTKNKQALYATSATNLSLGWGYHLAGHTIDIGRNSGDTPITINGHITASGPIQGANISASGHMITTHLTASGHISASGSLTANNIKTYRVYDNAGNAGSWNTYIDFPTDSANKIAITNAGREQWDSGYSWINLNAGGNDVNVTIKGSGDDYLIRTDAGLDRVGIGYSTPASKLAVDGDVYVGTHITASSNIKAGGVISASSHIYTSQLNVANQEAMTYNSSDYALQIGNQHNVVMQGNVTMSRNLQVGGPAGELTGIISASGKVRGSTLVTKGTIKTLGQANTEVSIISASSGGSKLYIGDIEGVDTPTDIFMTNTGGNYEFKFGDAQDGFTFTGQPIIAIDKISSSNALYGNQAVIAGNITASRPDGRVTNISASGHLLGSNLFLDQFSPYDQGPPHTTTGPGQLFFRDPNTVNQFYAFLSASNNPTTQVHIGDCENNDVIMGLTLQAGSHTLELGDENAFRLHGGPVKHTENNSYISSSNFKANQEISSSDVIIGKTISASSMVKAKELQIHPGGSHQYRLSEQGGVGALVLDRVGGSSVGNWTIDCTSTDFTGNVDIDGNATLGDSLTDRVHAKGHFTASGHISSSETVKASKFQINQLSAIYANAYGGINFGQQAGLAIRVNHLTASAGITASGNIHTDGHISSSDYVNTAEYYVNGRATITETDLELKYGYETDITSYTFGRAGSVHDPFLFYGSVTASNNLIAGGHISASGHIYLSNNTKILSTEANSTYIELQVDDGWNFNANGNEIFSAFSTEFVVNDPGSANVDFRVVSDHDDKAIYVDSSLDSIQLGSSVGTTVTASGDIKADGDISASGNVYATDLYVGNEQFTDVNVYENVFGIGQMGQGSLQLANITASGAISASGVVYAKDILIPSNGAIYWDDAIGGSPQKIEGQDNYLTINGDNTLNLTADEDINFRGSTGQTSASINPNAGHITASGNISASSTSILTVPTIQGGQMDGDQSGSIELSGSLTLRSNEAIPAASSSVLYNNDGHLYWSGGLVGNYHLSESAAATSGAEYGIIKILHHMWINDDGNLYYNTSVEGDGSNFYLKANTTTLDLYCFIDIPYGWQAVAVQLYGVDSDGNSSTNFYEYNITDGTRSAIATTPGTYEINTGGEASFDSPLVGTATNALMIDWDPDDTTDGIYGGYVKIQRIGVQ